MTVFAVPKLFSKLAKLKIVLLEREPFKIHPCENFGVPLFDVFVPKF